MRQWSKLWALYAVSDIIRGQMSISNGQVMRVFTACARTLQMLMLLVDLRANYSNMSMPSMPGDSISLIYIFSAFVVFFANLLHSSDVKTKYLPTDFSLSY